MFNLNHFQKDKEAQQAHYFLLVREALKNHNPGEDPIVTIPVTSLSAQINLTTKQIIIKTNFGDFLQNYTSSTSFQPQNSSVRHVECVSSPQKQSVQHKKAPVQDTRQFNI